MLTVFKCFYQNLVLVTEYRVDFDKQYTDVCFDEFPVPQIDRKSKEVKNSDMKNFICNQYGENSLF